MPRMIKLHTAEGATVYPNTNQIESVIENNGTRVYTNGTDYWLVIETPSEVVAMIEQGDRDLVEAVNKLTATLKAMHRDLSEYLHPSAKEPATPENERATPCK